MNCRLRTSERGTDTSKLYHAPTANKNSSQDWRYLVVIIGGCGAWRCHDCAWIGVRDELASGADVGEDTGKRGCIFCLNPFGQSCIELRADRREERGEKKREDKDGFHGDIAVLWARPITILKANADSEFRSGAIEITMILKI